MKAGQDSPMLNVLMKQFGVVQVGGFTTPQPMNAPCS
jgi:hypothetical protein